MFGGFPISICLEISDMKSVFNENLYNSIEFNLISEIKFLKLFRTSVYIKGDLMVKFSIGKYKCAKYQLPTCRIDFRTSQQLSKR